MIPEQELDHKQTGRDLFTSQFKGRKVIQGIWDSLAKQVQELEDVFFDILDQRLLDVAIGAQLNVLGALVGQLRYEYDDTAFRKAIRLRIRVNRSKGKAEDIIDVLRLAYPTQVRDYREYYPASFSARVIEADGARAMRDLLHDAKPAGVRGTFEFSSWTNNDTMVFGHTTAGVVPTEHGFGHTSGSTIGRMTSYQEL